MLRGIMRCVLIGDVEEREKEREREGMVQDRKYNLWIWIGDRLSIWKIAPLLLRSRFAMEQERHDHDGSKSTAALAPRSTATGRSSIPAGTTSTITRRILTLIPGKTPSRPTPTSSSPTARPRSISTAPAPALLLSDARFCCGSCGRRETGRYCMSAGISMPVRGRGAPLGSVPGGV